MKKAILGLAGLVLLACVLAVTYEYISQFLGLGDSDKLSSETNTRQPAEPPQNKPPDIVEPEPSGIPQPPVEQTPIIPDVIAVALEDARATERAGDTMAARNAYSAVFKNIVIGGVSVSHREKLLDSIRDSLNRLNREIYFNKWNLYESQEFYVVKGGDNLTGIARKFGTTPDFLVRVNGITDMNLIRVGDKLKIVRGPFNAIIDKSECRMYVLHGEELFCEYDVSVGRKGRETPSDTYRIGQKERRPDWTDPDTGAVYKFGDSEYPLGEYWIPLCGDTVGRIGIGIHGRSGEAADMPIGGAVSRGCVRMRNSDVKVLFALLTSGVSKVKIVE